MSNAIIIGSSSGVSASPLTITVPGTLAIQGNAGQLPAFFNAATVLHGATMTVGSAPTGTSPSELVVQLALATSPPTVLFTLTIALAALSVLATSAQLTSAGTIPANTNIVLNVTNVGNDFGGANLTLNLF
jgi:hypothetical protein